MAEAATPYPLQWPAGHARTTPERRRKGRFLAHLSRDRISIYDALRRLQTELDRIGARYPVISSNVETRLDGRPRSDRRAPEDPGIAVYFQLAGKPHCLPCDTYDRVADNIAAVAAHIEATRAIERHGVATVAEMFSGFLQLPSPEMQRPRRQVFELHREPQVTLANVEAAYRRLARERHPDQGGSDTMMAELNLARDAARRELSE